MAHPSGSSGHGMVKNATCRHQWKTVEEVK